MSRAGIFVVAGGALLVAVGLTLGQVGEEPGALPNWQALILGIVQGDEPAHLLRPSHPRAVSRLGLPGAERQFNQTFDVALHVGTLVAVVSYFWADVKRLVAAWLGSFAGGGSRRRTSGSPGSSRSPRFPPR